MADKGDRIARKPDHKKPFNKKVELDNIGHHYEKFAFLEIAEILGMFCSKITYLFTKSPIFSQV